MMYPCRGGGVGVPAPVYAALRNELYVIDSKQDAVRLAWQWRRDLKMKVDNIYVVLGSMRRVLKLSVLDITGEKIGNSLIGLCDSRIQGKRFYALISKEEKIWDFSSLRSQEFLAIGN
jgi:hypothetical protein